MLRKKEWPADSLSSPSAVMMAISPTLRLNENFWSNSGSTSWPRLRGSGAQPVLPVVDFRREVQPDPAILFPVDLNVENAFCIGIGLRLSVGDRLETQLRLQFGQIDREVTTSGQSNSSTDQATFAVNHLGAFRRHFQQLFKRFRTRQPFSRSVPRMSADMSAIWSTCFHSESPSKASLAGRSTNRISS